MCVWKIQYEGTQTAAIFGDQDISRCLTNLFLVVERTNRISLASFSDLQSHAHDIIIMKKFATWHRHYFA